MKVIVKATEEVDTHYGDVQLEAKKDERLTLGLREAEIALATGKFKFEKQVAESDVDTALLELQAGDSDARKKELLEKSHDDLFDLAKDFEGVKKSMSKPQLVEEILRPRPPVVVETTSETSE